VVLVWGNWLEYEWVVRVARGKLWDLYILGKVLLPKNLIKGVLRVARVGFMVNTDK
jgi:hypothetical protein